ncbi:MaoC domain-containing protein dehydratase [Salinarchaeum sp. Harcht-Bsk1]|uniref:MaoC family dehydratase n=1 Tax=Salinarchaeum sp. Harcht-Bsk1 TaxID=1333523 RepID=UPI000342435D|nr:hotdog domain-containing protein [Salinarchaeum sp. Harcht-Bsk1]AGN00745.1 MaoC domain-containing protein dehydratase [Salinarchaeum sp. Harcht-Bsk1]
MTEHPDGPPEVPVVGDGLTHERSFTTEEVLEYGRLTGDDQPIHTEPDEDGRLVVQGLLTGSLATKIGGDLNYVARTMEFEFRKPVYTGERITCECTVESRSEQEDRYLLEIDVEYRNDGGDVVAAGATSGVIWKQNAQ